MTGFKGTPGPWAVSYADNPKHGSSWGGYWQIDAQYDAVACNQFCYAGNNKPDVSDANARLIAAAPDLVKNAQANLATMEETLSRLLRADMSCHELSTAIDETRAALSRALGEGERS